MWRGGAFGVLIAALIALGAPGGAWGADKAIWGPVDLPDGSSAFPLYRSLGTDVYQADLHWADVAPTRPAQPLDPGDPAYQWPPAIDRAVREGSHNGMGILLRVITSPSWATAGESRVHAPNDPRHFADFLRAAARRYPTVRRWMIWSEPNMGAFFQPNAANSPLAARLYARLLDAAFGALKEESARNIVIGGNTWSGGDVKPVAFLRWMRLPSGRPPRLDWFGHNPFPFRFPDLKAPTIRGGFRDISDLDDFSAEIRRAYRRVCAPGRPNMCAGTMGPRLWLSEFTVLSDHPAAFPDSVTRAQQARWLTAAFRIADNLPEVAGMGWFTLLDDRESLAAHSHWGLLDEHGRPKPAFAAFRAAPSGRSRPRVDVVSETTPQSVADGLTVRLVQRRSGTIILTLEGPSGDSLGGRRISGTRGQRHTVRLRDGSLPDKGPLRLEARQRGASTVHRAIDLRRP